MIVRKEVHLDDAEIFWLQKAADKKKWSLKKYMEEVLKSDSVKVKNRITLSEKSPAN